MLDSLAIVTEIGKHTGSAMAGVIMIAIGFALRSLGRWLLGRVKTKWGRRGISTLWRILSIFFGRGIILENAIVEPEGKQAYVEALKADAQKRYAGINLTIESK